MNSSRENKYDDNIKLREKGLGISISLGENVNFLLLDKFIPERVAHGFF